MCFGFNILSVSELCCRGFCMAGNSSKRLMKKDVKVGYGILSIFFCVSLTIVMFFLADWFDFLAEYVGCNKVPSGQQTTCIATNSAFR